MEEKRECLQCGKKLIGRSDKRFCNMQCRNHYNTSARNQDAQSYIKKVNRILLKNRKILSQLMPVGEKKAYIDKMAMAENGFNFQYCTGTYVNNVGKMYYYVYDFGWMEFSLQEVMLVRK